jgi:serine/threonine protein phosphatase PrpC
MRRGCLRLYVRAAAHSETGPQRSYNEDGAAILALGAATPASTRGGTSPIEGAWPTTPGVVLAVVDGMGGQRTGDVATLDAIEAFGAHFGGDAPDDREARRAWAARALDEAGRRVAHAHHPGYSDGARGATAALVVAFEAELHVAHAGDVRVYRFRDSQLEALTRDDSLANQLSGRGLPAAELATVPKNVLTKMLGFSDPLEPTARTLDGRPGDVILICSDGLHTAVSDEAMAGVLRHVEHPGEACKALVALAERADSDDNITALVARLQAIDEGPPG